MSFWTSLANFIKKLISSYNNSTTTTTTPIGTNTTTTLSPNVPNPSGKLLTAFLLPGKPGSKYTNSAGRDSTLCFCNDNDRTAMNDERDYLINYLKSIRANCIPMIINNDDGGSKDSYINPWGNGKWGGPIPSAKLEYLAWMHYKDNDKLMYGYKCENAGLSQLPILFCSENRGGPFSNPSWAEQFIKDMVPFWIQHGNVKWICTHLEAEKFVTPDEVNRIAGLVKKYMPNVGTMVHATNTDFAKCNVDAVAVQMPWHPKDGDSKDPSEVVKVLQTYFDAGSKHLICSEYNWNSEGARAKAQGQAALNMSNNVIGVWNGW